MRRSMLIIFTALLLVAFSGSVEAAVQYKEAPMLADLVRAGKIPSVDKRLPDKPMVIEAIEGVGKYGGQLNVFNQDFPRDQWSSTLLRVPRSGVGSDPELAESYKVSADRKSLTLYLRKGLKWSDGAPFTAEDIRFAYDDMNNYEAPKYPVRTWGASRMVTATEVLDEYSIKLICPTGVKALPLILAAWQGSQSNAFHPAHYLKKWHIKYNPDADKLAKEGGKETWTTMMLDKYWWAPTTNLELPHVSPWVLKDKTSASELYERNPYYWKVDGAGNQLPYIDKVAVQIVDAEVYQLKVSSGVADLAWFTTSFTNIPLYKQNADKANYRVLLHPGVQGSVVKFEITKTYKDPVLRDIYANVKFKQALSVAVDRDDINKTVYMGLGVPGQIAPLKSVSYYANNWRDYYAQYDPALANRLLDEIGLKKGADGFRVRPDGQPISIVLDFHRADYTPVIELVSAYWNAVGVKTTFKLGEVGLIEQRMFQNDLFAYIHGEPNIPYCSERQAYADEWVWKGSNNQGWTDWLNEKQKVLRATMAPTDPMPDDWFTRPLPAGTDVSKFPGIKPSDEYLKIRSLENSFLNYEMGSPEYVKTAQTLFDFYVKMVNRIGFVGEIPQVMIASNKLGNVLPPKWYTGMALDFQLVTHTMDQLFFK